MPGEGNVVNFPHRPSHGELRPRQLREGQNEIVRQHHRDATSEQGLIEAMRPRSDPLRNDAEDRSAHDFSKPRSVATNPESWQVSKGPQRVPVVHGHGIGLLDTKPHEASEHQPIRHRQVLRAQPARRPGVREGRDRDDGARGPRRRVPPRGAFYGLVAVARSGDHRARLWREDQRPGQRPRGTEGKFGNRPVLLREEEDVVLGSRAEGTP
mmetsp:Transcript_16192/g.56559  ORF Transcript_16192/g.56559 Transcript_16192/m.56559 type:complete len:211 (-) Transcript_16192:738-1370(-)